ncbi:MAG TPA: hypothetical protein VKA26_12000 [Ignavibacteriaceae bacterium]|nr:hypothetical protein [Ignavibacteriaceae bacterium]
MKKYFIILFFAIIGSYSVFANSVDADSIEVYVIDSYITPENPAIFNLSFFASAPVKAKLYVDNRYEFLISDSLSDSHEAKIDLDNRKFSGKTVPFYILVQDSTGYKNRSEIYDLDFPREIKVDKESNFLLLGVFFGMQFLLPTPTIVGTHRNNFFALTKEVPLISFRSNSINYPFGYFSIEYSHIFNADASNFFRFGYKQIIEVPLIKYISPGLNGFTNFNGYNGVSLEVSAGLFNMLNSFTIYARYRFNTQPSHNDRDFHEVSLGFYSNFFSFHF